MATYYQALDETSRPERRRRWWGFLGRNLAGLSVTLMALLLLGIVLWPYMVINVPSGHVGVLWYRFLGFDANCWCFVDRGTVLDPRQVKEEGLHIIAPWNRMFIYDLRLQSRNETYRAISKDGVSVTAEINIRYQLLHDSVGVLHKFVGPDYFDTILAPEIGSQAREVISRYTAQEVYTSRDRIQREIQDGAQKTLAEKLDKLVQPAAIENQDPEHYSDFLASSILILDTLVLGIDLPPPIIDAINRQTEQFYMIEEYKYRVQREAEESQRKMIEANGIAAFQRTVSQGISDSYLRWQGINATLALAQSPNSKIVIIGAGKDGLPIILGNLETPTTGPAPQPGAGGGTPPAAIPPGKSDRQTPGQPPTSRMMPGTEEPTSSGLPGGPVADNPLSADGMPRANSAAALGGPAGPLTSSSPAQPSAVNSILSRIYGIVRSPSPAPSSGPGGQPKP
jgi:regulator of protease activity HflC (stomatin/prohibitin superfamily)